MSELQTIEKALETFLAKAETDAEKLLASAATAVKNTLSALAKNPAVMTALQNGLSVAASTVIGAAEAGGAGAIAGAVEGSAKVLLKDVEVPAGSALVQIVQGEIAAAVEAPTVAIPQVVNP